MLQIHLLADHLKYNSLIFKYHFNNKLFFQVTTVDNYQGQQNDYILLSLVRTKTVGHLRDVRRLVVALSRARLGLYIFARVHLFKNCFELAKAFDILTKRPLDLHLIPTENYGSNTRNYDETPIKQSFVITNMPDIVQFVYQFYQKKIEEWKQNKPEIFKTIIQQQRVEEKEEQMEVTVDKTNEKIEDADEDFGFEKLTEDDDGTKDQEEIEIDIDKDNEEEEKNKDQEA